MAGRRANVPPLSANASKPPSFAVRRTVMDDRQNMSREAQLTSLASTPPRGRVARQLAFWIVNRRDEARRGLHFREQHQANAATAARRSVEDASMASVTYQVADDPACRLDAFKECSSFPVAVGLRPDRRPVLDRVAAREINDAIRRHEKRDQSCRLQQRRLALIFCKRCLGIGCKVPRFDIWAIESSARQGRAGTAFWGVRPSRRERAMEWRSRPERSQNHPVEPDSIDTR
jgi:hypothetical protein